MTTSTWTRAGRTSNWFLAANWSPNEIPGASSDVVLPDDLAVTANGVNVFNRSIGTVSSLVIATQNPHFYSLAFESAGHNTIATTLINGGTIDVWDGTTLSIGGTLNNENILNIGDRNVIAPVEVDVGFLRNGGGGSINMAGSASAQALLNDSSRGAGFGTVGLLKGDAELHNCSAIEFGFGQITTIGTDSFLALDGSAAFVEDAGALGSNSALRGLADIIGTLVLNEGASVSTTGAVRIEKSGQIALDFSLNLFGGSSLTIGGLLTNDGAIGIGNTSMTASEKLSATGLDNEGLILIDAPSYTIAASLNVAGQTTNNGEISITSDSERLAGAVTGTGTFDLFADARLELGGSVSSGQTVTFQGAGDLALKAASFFAGTIAGFAANDKIDALSFAFGQTSANYVENAGHTAGVLTLTDGVQVANIAMTGDYTNANFALAADSAGTGTFVKFA